MRGSRTSGGLPAALAALAMLLATASADGQGAGRKPAKLIVDPASGCGTSNPFPRRNETIRWTGGCRDGLLDGPGVLRWYENGIEYERDEGSFLAGELDGPATVTFPGGNTIHGRYDRGVRDGPFTVVQPDGRLIRATYQNGQFVSEREMSAEEAAAFRTGVALAAPVAPAPPPAVPLPPAAAAAPAAPAAPPVRVATPLPADAPIPLPRREGPPLPSIRAPAPPPATAAPASAALPPVPPALRAAPLMPPPPPPPAARARTPLPPPALAVAPPLPAMPPASPFRAAPAQPMPYAPSPSHASPPPVAYSPPAALQAPAAAPLRLRSPSPAAVPPAGAAPLGTIEISSAGVVPAGAAGTAGGGHPQADIAYGPGTLVIDSSRGGRAPAPLYSLQGPGSGPPTVYIGGEPGPVAAAPPPQLPAPATARPAYRAAALPAPLPPPSQRFSVNLVDAEVRDAASAVLGTILKQPYEVSDMVRGRVTIAPDRQLEAYELLSALRLQLRTIGAELREHRDGYAIVPAGS